MESPKKPVSSVPDDLDGRLLCLVVFIWLVETIVLVFNLQNQFLVTLNHALFAHFLATVVWLALRKYPG